MVVPAAATAEAALAITEPRETQPGGGPPWAGGPAGTRPRHGRRRWALAGVAVLLTAALVVLVVLAGAYQPIQFGGASGVSFPGLPTAAGHERQGWITADTFYVEERFLTFTHWVAISFAIPWLFHQPADPGQEPAKDLTCLTR
jgi:hypothetical protein